MAAKAFWDTSAMGQTIVGAEEDGYKWYFNSRFDDDVIAKGWVSQIEAKGIYDIFIIFGASNMNYVKKLREKYSENMIIVFEPDEDIYNHITEDKDLEAYIDENDIVISCDENEMSQILAGSINYTNRKYVRYIVMPGYDEVYKLQSVKIRYIIAKAEEDVIFNRNTAIIFEEAATKNSIYNMTDAIESNVLSDILKAMEKYKNVPAIIVSAGPSLDKNIDELKRVKNKAFIIAVDSAVNAMVAHEILPDVIITIDPKKSLYRFYMEQIQDVPLICAAESNRNIRQVYRGKRFYFFFEKNRIMKLVDGNRKNMLGSGGSVANTAFDLARVIGASEIVLIGQDLSYPEGKKHAESVYSSGNNDIDEANRQRYYEIDGYYGGKVVTETNLDIYKKWFEEVIKAYQNLKVYNATEGGAMIHGAINIPLSEYIDTHCDKLSEVDFSELLRSIPPHFDDLAKEKKKTEVLDIYKKEIPDFKALIKECKKNYEEFNKLNLQGKNTNSHFVKVTKKIIELQDEIDNHQDKSFINMYNAIKMFTLEEKVLDTKDTPYEENKELYKRGIEMMDIYEESADMFSTDLKEALIECGWLKEEN